MKTGRARRRRSGSTLLPFYIMLAGCSALGQAPANTVPPTAPEHPSAKDSPAEKPLPALGSDSVEPDEAAHIYFARRATHVDPAGQGKLRLHAERLKRNPQQVVYLAAYAESLGSASYELAIANQRVEAVTKLLGSYGVARRQIHPLRRYGVARGGPPPVCPKADCRETRGRVVLSYGTR